MSDQVEITRFRGEGEAECETCESEGREFPRGATRERARQHAKRSGHFVRYVIEDTTLYQGKATA